MSVPSAKGLTPVRAIVPRRTLWVRTGAGPKCGFGHLRRSLILARRLRTLAHPIFLLDGSDRWSREQVETCGCLRAVFSPSHPWPELEPPALLLVDTRREAGLDELLAAARDFAVPVASVHDLGLSPLPSDIIIDGSIPSAPRHAPPQSTGYFGTRYMILDDACARFHDEPKPVRPSIRKIVVNLGGGDSGKYFRTVLEGLASLASAPEVIGFPGFCDWGQNEWARLRPVPPGFRWASREEDPIGLMFRADLMITAGGTSLYEALAVGTPACALSYDRHQQATVEAISAAGACIDLGRGSHLAVSPFADTVCALEADRDMRRRLSVRGRRLVDGRGARRVARILRTLIRNSPRTAANRTRIRMHAVPGGAEHGSLRPEPRAGRAFPGTQETA